MSIPAIIVICILFANLFVTGVLHGKPQPKNNVFITLIDLLIMLGLLAWGGFFA